jgi:RimJ/RimL family protein N-acetyltransferase
VEEKMKNYIFKSNRLGFRNWLPSDVDPMSEINAASKVMEFFPAIQSQTQTIEFIERMQNQFTEKGFCYFAVDKLEDETFIGFIGLSEQTFESDFTPCIDIGWRLSEKEWNKGFATEGAKRCLGFAFHELKLEKIKAICPKINFPSENVMKKIGMKKIAEFKHPKLLNDERLQDCVVYEIACSSEVENAH